MKLLQIIPFHDYLEGVLRLADFAVLHYEQLFGQGRYRIVLVNSGSTPAVGDAVTELARRENFVFRSSGIKGSLKDALYLGVLADVGFRADVMHVTETDAIPDLSVLRGMLSLFEEERENGLASVSPMYKWQGRYCYPTHRHWHTDATYMLHNTVGEVSNVGIAGVPFLYSLWNPEILRSVNQPAFRSFLHLDSDLGSYAHLSGFRHLRIKGMSIEHFGGGRNSRG